MREAFIVRDGESATITGERGDYVSLLPLSDTGAVVTTWGLKYDLLGIRLEYGSTRGVSNELARGRKGRLRGGRPNSPPSRIRRLPAE